MLQKLLSHPLFYIVVIAAVVLGVIICIFPHHFPSIPWGVNYAVMLMLLYLAAGMVLLFAKQPKLTFVCFAGSALLCFFLKYSVKNDSIERWRQTVIKKRMPGLAADMEPPLSLAHLNITNIGSAAEALEVIRKSRPDVLSVHEVTPDWDQWLKDSLTPIYPFHHSLVDIGIFGMAIFSKFELEHTDTFYYQNIPNLRTCLDRNGNAICLVSMHTEPALNSFSFKRLREHLATATGEIKDMDVPLLVFGDFNAVSWSDEIQAFMDSTGLMESRTGFMTSGSPLDIPFDHIFYTRHMRCNDFYVLKSPSSRHLGIFGTYEFNQQHYNVRKTAQ